MAAIAAALLGLQVFVYTRLAGRSNRIDPVLTATVTANISKFGPLAGAAVSQREARPVYRHSVIPGGAYSVPELRRALEVDDVAARHYQVFRRADLRVDASPFTKPVYVSYRVGSRIFWTSRPIALQPGETVLTDGTNYARARCGNRIETTPQRPVQPAGPKPEELEITDAPPVNLPAVPRASLLAVDLVPPFYPETPANTVAMMPIVLPVTQPGYGFGLFPLGGGILPFQSPVQPVPVIPPNGPVQPPPLPYLPAITPPATLQCCFILPPPPVTPPDSPPIVPPPVVPPVVPSVGPPVVPPVIPPLFPPLFAPPGPPNTPPGTPPGTPPYTPPNTPPNTPPITPPNTPPPYTPPNTPPYTPPDTPPNSPPTPPFTVESTPEPGSAFIMLLGLGALGVPWVLHRKRRRP